MARCSTRWSGPELAAVIPAAGTGTRMASAVPKQYLRLAGQSVLFWSLRCVLSHPAVTMAMVAVSVDDPHWEHESALIRAALRTRAGIDKPILSTIGGERRQDSVRAGLRALDSLTTPPDWVLVHDAVRPCVSLAELDRLIRVALADSATDAGGALLAVPVRDTLKSAAAATPPAPAASSTNLADDAMTTPRVAGTVDRSALWQALTPQCFRRDCLLDALDAAESAGETVTDEAQALERLGRVPRLVEGASTNLKLTWPGDLPLLDALLAAGVTAAGSDSHDVQLSEER